MAIIDFYVKHEIIIPSSWTDVFSMILSSISYRLSEKLVVSMLRFIQHLHENLFISQLPLDDKRGD